VYSAFAVADDGLPTVVHVRKPAIRVEQWPLVVLKELIDNSLDACEEAGIAAAPTLSGARQHHQHGALYIGENRL
jgi:hypothetical protein